MTDCQVSRHCVRVPKTRTDRGRDEKVTEILDIAERQLVAGGYNAVAIAAVARELGLAHNAIYWYFPSKDHLVVAAFEHSVQKLFVRKPKDEGDVVVKVMWFVDQLGELYKARASMHAEATRSEVISTYLDDLSERLRAMIRNVLRPYLPEDQLDVAAAAFAATVQGSFVEGIDPAQRRRLLAFSLERLLGSSHE